MARSLPADGVIVKFGGTAPSTVTPGNAVIAIAIGLLSFAAPAQDTARFQQEVEYRIEARLDEETDVLTGRARLVYTNRSSASLDTLWFHQHLNAFRPNSAWARRELELGNRRFQDLRRDEHAYERLTAVTVDERNVSPVYPGAPDSTVVAIPLAAPIPPGGSVTVLLDWTARPSTLPRRQGRRGRHYDFAQWYPRIAVYDRGGWQVQPLLPQGEFYGEFGSYDVTLDLAADQVVGSTGVPVEGDPGWAGAAAGGTTPDLQRDAYAAEPAEPLGLIGAAAEAGRKHVRWRAEDVHHFAWSVDPEYIPEQGGVARTGVAGQIIPIHVLYLPGDDDWANGVALRRTEEALRWLQEMFGPYPWPQLTNLHRIEGGGTEFPMVIMDGSASEGLIVHEVTHQYLHGILANNEWRDGWLDEGFTSFVSAWYAEDHGAEDVWQGALASIRERERAGATEVIARPGEAFSDPGTYTAMTYTKTSIIFMMLREMVGHDTMRAILRELYDRHNLDHFHEPDLRRVVNDVTGQNLDWFFDRWFHTTDTLDYGIGDLRTERTPTGWRTAVEVIRLGGAWMPVTLQVGDVRRELTSRERVHRVEVVTAVRPAWVALDPDQVLLDLDYSNNVREM